ncbi:unnamed protein product [Echinostoma caproni]|uniref:DUF5734 domain-containing protein n=1 Tax=Echinostoma caproni TaxID=27848 RepID=A0A183AAN9_9TREM|nr:unnamed protein product [Echinostoma caproni]
MRWKNSDKKPGGLKIDEKLQMRATVNLTRLDIERVPQIFSPKKNKNLRFATLVASTPNASFVDITTDEPTIIGILKRKSLSSMKLAHAPAKEIKGPIKVPNFRPITGIKGILGNPPPRAIPPAHTPAQTKSYFIKKLRQNPNCLQVSPGRSHSERQDRTVRSKTPPFLPPIDRSRPPDRMKPHKTDKSTSPARNMDGKHMAPPSKKLSRVSRPPPSIKAEIPLQNSPKSPTILLDLLKYTMSRC